MTLSDSWDTPPSNPNNRLSSVSCLSTMDMRPNFRDFCRVCKELNEIYFIEPLRHVSQLGLVSSPDLAKGSTRLAILPNFNQLCCNKAFLSLDSNLRSSSSSRNLNLNIMVHGLLLLQKHFHQKHHPGHHSAFFRINCVNCSVAGNIRNTAK